MSYYDDRYDLVDDVRDYERAKSQVIHDYEDLAYGTKKKKKSNGAWKFWIQVAIVLVLIGAINWFVVGVTGFSNPNNSFDLIKPTLGPIWIYLPYIIYFLVGIAGFVLIWALIVKGTKKSKTDKGNDWDLGY